ncbi:DUF4214 domain-containing protein [Massilia sp. METH4]|uniref:DUF4214 domain-containing protein n=1 Tax=Massilia sp. METH4 TaxID=3123041 RepID=UPI0030D2CA25
MVTNTGNIAIDALVYSSWKTTANTPVTLTYGFLTRAPVGASAEDQYGFLAMTATQQAAVRVALAQWSAVANVTFVEVAANGGQLQFGTNAQTGSSAYAYLPNGYSSVQMYLNNKVSYTSNFTTGSYGPSVLIHEIGHMLGLKHPGDYDAAGSSIGGPFLPAETDNGDYTQMSYQDPSSYAINRTFATSAMLYDIQAIQYLYGANTTYRVGNDVYQFSSGTAPQCIWDAGGSDTLDFSACAGASVINLNAGAFSETARGMNNVSIAYNVTIENAIGGSGGTAFYGNGIGNRLTGGAGADVFYQGVGSDTIAGGAGQDTVVFSRSSDDYIVLREGGTLTVSGEGTDILTGIEYLRFADGTLGMDAFGAATTQLGSGNNDILTVPAGAAHIDGGAGLDVAVFSGARAGYQIVRTAEGYSVTSNTTGVADVLVNVERLDFGDGNVALDIDAGAGQLYRVYAAAFDRAPDDGGFGYWLKALDAGVRLGVVAEEFARSPEFMHTYGALDNAGFVTQLYANVLDRSYDQGGFDYWLAVLNAGAARGDVLTGFSESAELQANLIGTIINGVNYTPYA